MVTVKLDQDEMTACRRQAVLRQQAVDARGGRSQGPSKDPIGQNMVGIMGEMAFAKWSGMITTASQGVEFNQNTDFDKCEVRTRRRNTDRELFIKNRKFNQQPPSTIYVLAWADPDNPHVELVGWTTLGTICDYGYPGTFDCTRFDRNLLRPMEAFRP